MRTTPESTEPIDRPWRGLPAKLLPAPILLAPMLLVPALWPSPAAAGDGTPAEEGTPAATSATVAPGQLVRWPGEGVESCRRATETWEPLRGECWYPVDLLAPEGPMVLERRREGRWESVVVEVEPYPYAVQHLTIRDHSRVDLSPEDQARAARESRAVGRLWASRRPRAFTLPLQPPLETMPVSARFGDRRVINGQPRNPHTGADYRAAAGSRVGAVADGVVVLAEEHFFAGNSVFVDHGDGLISMYFHLRDLAVEEGRRVTAGQRLGTVGATGRATGPHLHFGIRWRGARLDPEGLFSPATVPVVAAGADGGEGGGDGP